MARNKRFVANVRHQRKRKAAKRKLRLHEQGKIKANQLSSLARRFQEKRHRAESRRSQ
jgi:hypothetical protein